MLSPSNPYPQTSLPAPSPTQNNVCLTCTHIWYTVIQMKIIILFYFKHQFCRKFIWMQICLFFRHIFWQITECPKCSQVTQTDTEYFTNLTERKTDESNTCFIWTAATDKNGYPGLQENRLKLLRKGWQVDNETGWDDKKIGIIVSIVTSLIIVKTFYKVNTDLLTVMWSLIKIAYWLLLFIIDSCLTKMQNIVVIT